MSEEDKLERNRLGPYEILRRLRGVTTAAEVGRVYKAKHRLTGRPALVVRGVAQSHHIPLQDWRIRVRAATKPEPYLALEVERAPEGATPLGQLDAGLDVLACALEGLEQHPEAAVHLGARKAPAVRMERPATNWRWLAVAAGLAVAALAPRAWRSAQTPGEQQPEPAALASVAEEVLAEPEALPVGNMDGREALPGIARDMPKKLFRGQYRTDSEGKCKGRLETPINGGCWVALKKSPPCGDDAYEWKDTCYWPSMPAPKEPSSTLPHPPPVPAAR
ncbi:hypothetical protein [Hyalangium minutum]|uniref:Uncharacterized protein n=1 Tax=Hyalangium minutum TaxID=394096 RepID=A0A085VXD8_9BACT|nr:hypothetical protein [Hyalangium minutum]KFE60101.1 hypothetical protein DB31_5972 [Hyalangium minutum]